MERRLAEALDQRMAVLEQGNAWCREQLAAREARVAELERANSWAQQELSRLRTIIQAVGVIASQAEPPPEPALGT